MNKSDHILSIIFSFILSFFLFLLLLIGTTKISLMSENYILNVLENVDYYEGIAKELNNDFANGAGAAGFHPDIYKNYIKSEEVKELSVKYIKDYFDTNESQIETTSFKTNLNTYLHDIAKKEKINLTQEDETRLKEYIDINADAYSKYLSFPFIQYLIMGFDILDSVIPFLLIACIVIIGLSLFFMYRLKLKRKDYVYYIGSSLGGTSLMLLVIPAFVLLNRFIQRINLTPECYYRFVVQYIEVFLYTLIIISIMLFILVIILNLIYKRSEHKISLKQGKIKEKV